MVEMGRMKKTVDIARTWTANHRTVLTCTTRLNSYYNCCARTLLGPDTALAEIVQYSSLVLEDVFLMSRLYLRIIKEKKINWFEINTIILKPIIFSFTTQKALQRSWSTQPVCVGG